MSVFKIVQRLKEHEVIAGMGGKTLDGEEGPSGT
jgi:hypothetical protein